jgi:hypothetical protein
VTSSVCLFLLSAACCMLSVVCCLLSTVCIQRTCDKFGVPLYSAVSLLFYLPTSLSITCWTPILHLRQARSVFSYSLLSAALLVYLCMSISIYALVNFAISGILCVVIYEQTDAASLHVKDAKEKAHTRTHTHTHTHAHMRTETHTCAQECTHVYAHTQAHARTCADSRTQKHTQTYIQTHIDIHTYRNTHTYPPTHPHTYPHTYTHTHTHSLTHTGDRDVLRGYGGDHQRSHQQVCVCVCAYFCMGTSTYTHTDTS